MGGVERMPTPSSITGYVGTVNRQNRRMTGTDKGGVTEYMCWRLKADIIAITTHASSCELVRDAASSSAILLPQKPPARTHNNEATMAMRCQPLRRHEARKPLNVQTNADPSSANTKAGGPNSNAPASISNIQLLSLRAVPVAPPQWGLERGADPFQGTCG